MSDSGYTEVQVQNFLAAITDALMTNPHADLRSFAAAYNIPRDVADELIDLVLRLHSTLVEVHPAKAFTRRLGQELRGKEQGAFSTIRHLPTRVQLAAGITVIAGFIFYSRRRLNRSRNDSVEMPAFGQR